MVTSAKLDTILIGPLLANVGNIMSSVNELLTNWQRSKWIVDLGSEPPPISNCRLY
jgi:hypothetical protein